MTTLPEWANWLARDEDGSLFVSEGKPYKVGDHWEVSNSLNDGIYETETDDTFSHIEWTDEEPTSVKALIKEFSDKAESLRELGEALTRNWEAEHGKPSVAEYNQWQITQAKAHGYDEPPIMSDKTHGYDEPPTMDNPETSKIDRHGRYEKHRNLVDELHEIYVAKNKDYGNSFGESVDEFGIIAGVIRIGDKYNRLKTLAKGHEPLVNDESMIDTLKDMANYCLLTIIELEAIE